MAKKQKLVFQVEVLQNYSSVARQEFLLPVRKSVSLGAKSSDTLSIPFYKFKKSYRGCIKLRSNSAIIRLPWEGYAKNGNTVVDLEGKKSFTLKSKEFACLRKGDLIFMCRLVPYAKPEPKVANVNLKGGLFSLFASDSLEWKSVGLGVILASLLMGYVGFRLKNTDPYQKQDLADLPLQYSLPFVYPKHIENLPEAIQTKLDRKDYKKGAIQFAREFAASFLHFPFSGESKIFETTKNYNEHIFEQQENLLEKARYHREKLDERILAKDYTSVISIPTIEGESARDAISRVFDKIDLFHKTQEWALENKKKVIEEFINDPEYDFSKYKTKNIKGGKDSQDALSKIKPFESLSNEEEMYKSAQDLARRAANYQRHYFQKLEKHEKIADEALGTIGIDPSIGGSFLSRQLLTINDAKIKAIIASEYKKGGQGSTVREPLVGELEPSLVERAVRKNQFELLLCYEVALRRNRKTHGAMNWKWRIDTEGQISDLSLVSSSISDKKMHDCIREKIARWTFPRPKRGSVEVNFPFRFEKKNG